MSSSIAILSSVFVMLSAPRPLPPRTRKPDLTLRTISCACSLSNHGWSLQAGRHRRHASILTSLVSNQAEPLRFWRATALYAALTAAITYSLSVHPGTLVLSDSADTDLVVWLLSWDVHAFLH